jgi:pyruvate ferredoxin oxidoreductase delta subunit
LAKRETLNWQELKSGVSIDEAGNAVEYETGDWKSRRPVLDKEKCIKCGFCFLYCPEGCVRPNEEGYFISNLKYCKGCGICANECPKKAITMVVEGE